jgi:hypothetical protein
LKIKLVVILLSLNILVGCIGVATGGYEGSRQSISRQLIFQQPPQVTATSKTESNDVKPEATLGSPSTNQKGYSHGYNSNIIAQAYCWQEESGLYFCDGPIKTLNGWHYLETALGYSGCDNARMVRSHSTNKPNGWWMCGLRSLKSYERNVRKIRQK